MSSMGRTALTCLGAAAVFTALVGSAAAAQTTAAVDGTSITSTTTNDRADRADRLEEQANSLASRLVNLRKIADLHREAARIRGDDPRAIDNYRQSAWNYYNAGLKRRAREMMEQAAEQAMAVGDVERAATSYLDAALIAEDAGQNSRTRELVRKARAQLQSPILPADRRIAIERRLEGSGLTRTSSIR